MPALDLTERSSARDHRAEMPDREITDHETTAPAPADGAPAGPLWLPTGIGVAAVLVMIAIVTFVSSDVFDGRLFGPDAFSRINRLEHNVSSGDWSNDSFPLSNSPFGERIQWTQALDVVILLLAGPLALFLGWGDALFVGGSLVSPIFHVAAVVLAVWAARAITDIRRGLFAVGLLVVVQVRMIIPFAMGRPDHHGLILTLFIAHLGALLWAQHAPDRRMRLVSIAAAIGAVSVWVSPEGLLTVAPAVIWLGCQWILSNTWGAEMRRYGIVAAATLTTTWLVDPPPSGHFDVVYDRLSIVHVTMFLLLAALAFGLSKAQLASSARRAGLAMGGAAVALIVLFLVAPKIHHGPMADVPEDLWTFFLSDSEEWTPLFDGGFSIGALLSTLALPAIALVGYTVRYRAGNRAVILLAINHVVFAVLAMQQIRWAAYLGFLDALALAWMLGLVLRRFDTMQLGVASKALAGVAVLAAMAANPLLLALAPPSATTAAIDAAGLEGTCGEVDATAALADEVPGTVLAPLFWGPELVYMTDHSVIGSPMHRNVDGIRFTHDVMAASSDQARAQLAERGITHIVWCQGGEWAPRVSDAGLYAALQAGDAPAWLNVTSEPGTRLQMGRVLPD